MNDPAETTGPIELVTTPESLAAPINGIGWFGCHIRALSLVGDLCQVINE
jgi:hypothetical protein